MSATLQPVGDAEGADAIDVIENDHRAVDALFDRYEQLGRDGDPGQRWNTVRSIIDELRLHAAMEEQVFYPAVQEALGDEGDELVEESLREHAEAKEALGEIEQLEPTSDTFHDKVTQLIEEVRHHVEEEETAILPKLRERLDSQVLRDLGTELEGAKMTLLGVVIHTEAGEVRRQGRSIPVRAPNGAEEGSVVGEGEAQEQPERVAETRASVKPTARKPAAKKATAKRTTAKPTAARKTAAKKARARKTAAKSTAKRTTTGKTTSKRASARTGPARRPATRRAAAKRSSPPRRTASGRFVYRVTPTSTGRWAVARKGAARPSATFERKGDAVARGRELAKRGARGQLIVHSKDGRIRDEFTYGADPRRSRG